MIFPENRYPLFWIMLWARYFTLRPFGGTIHHMERHRQNHLHRLAALAAMLSVCAAMPFIADRAEARDWDPKLNDTAWACSTLYSRYPIKVQNGGDSSTAVCLGEGKKGRKAMSRNEAYELCRDQFDATTLLVMWTSKGWRCRYYGR